MGIFIALASQMPIVAVFLRNSGFVSTFIQWPLSGCFVPFIKNNSHSLTIRIDKEIQKW